MTPTTTPFRRTVARAALAATAAVPIAALVLAGEASAHHAEAVCASSGPGYGSWIISSFGQPEGVTIESITGLPAGAVITWQQDLQVEVNYIGDAISGTATWTNGFTAHFSGVGDCTYEPPVETTEPVDTTEPPIETTEPPVESTEPPVESTEPPVESTEPPVETTEPTESTEPPATTTPPETTEVPPSTPPPTEPPTVPPTSVVTVPPTTAPATSEPPVATTTTLPGPTVTTVAPPPTTGPSPSTVPFGGNPLPATGSSTARTLFAAVVLLGGGGFVLAKTRQPR